MRVIQALSVATALIAAGASLAAPAAAPAKAAGPQVFGKPLSNAASLPVGEVLAQSDKWDGKSVKVTGTVTKVCQAKGCWFEVAQDGQARGVRIKSADYSIFVPMDCAGRTATVEGTLITKTLSEAQAKHLAEDGAKAGEKPAAVTGPQKEFQIAAVAVELK